MEVSNDQGNLGNFIVGSVPTLIYVPNFVSDEEEELLLNSIYKAPVSKWKSLKNRRLQNWGGVVHEKGLLPQDLPWWLTKITEKISKRSGLFPTGINHVLINEYHPNQGIMPHQDGPAYYPVVAILSLGSPVVMDFTPHPSFGNCLIPTECNGSGDLLDSGATLANIDESVKEYQSFSIVLMPRSLLIFKDKAYSDYLHGIKDNPVQQMDGAVNISQITTRELISSAADTKDEIDANGANHKIISRSGTRISLTCRPLHEKKHTCSSFTLCEPLDSCA